MTEEIFEQARAIARAEAELVNLTADIQPRIDMLEASAGSIRKTIGELTLGIQYKREAVEQMKADLLPKMAGADRADFNGVSIIVKSVGGVQALELDAKYIKHPEELPEEFHKMVIQPDNDAIRAALAEGRELEFARLLPRKRTVLWEWKPMTDEDRAEVPEAFGILTALVQYYAPKEDKETQAFLPKAWRLAKELQNEKSSKDRRESSGDRESAASGGSDGADIGRRGTWVS